MGPASEPVPLSGRSFKDILLSKAQGIVDATRDAVYVARERHSSSRFNSLGYPQRAIRTHEHLFIQNLAPERWPAGAPQKYGAGSYPPDAEVLSRTLGPRHGGYHDIDACPTLDYLIAHHDDPSVARFLHLAVDKRPAEELYDIRQDPGCLKNLAPDPHYAGVVARLRARLSSYLEQTKVKTVWQTFSNAIEASNYAQQLTKQFDNLSFFVEDIKPPTDEELMLEFSHLNFGTY